MKAGTVFAIVLLIVFMLFSKAIISLFVDETEVIEIGAMALKISACFYIFLGAIHITRGLLNGAGDVRYAMINGFAEVGGRIGFAILLLNIPGTGYFAVWGTTCLTWLLTGIMSYARYKSGVWKKNIDHLSL